MEDLGHGLAHERRGVVDAGEAEALGEALFQLAHAGLDMVGHLQGVRSRQREDGQTDRRLAVHRQGVILVPGPQLGPGHVLQVDNLAIGAGLEDDAGELFGLHQPAESVHGVLEFLASGNGRLADLPGRYLHVLLAEDPDHVAGRQVPGLQPVRVQPHAHAVVLPAEGEDVAHPIDSRHHVQEVNGRIIAQVELVVIGLVVVGIDVGIEVDDQQDVRRPLADGHADGLDHVRQGRLGDGHSVLHQHLSHVHVGAHGERHVQHVRAVVVALRRHVEHLLDAHDLLLDRRGNGVGDDLGIGPGVAGRHAHHRRRDVGVLGDRQEDRGNSPHQEDHQRDHPGQHRTVDEEANQHNRLGVTGIETPGPVPGFAVPVSSRAAACP